MVKGALRNTKLHQDVQDFEKNRPQLRYPTGNRPFKSAEGMAELDDTWDMTSTADHVIAVEFPKGCSRREAMLKMHWSMMFFEIKKIDFEAAKARNISLKARVSKNTLSETINTIVESAKCADKASEMGLEAPLEHPIPTSWVTA